MRFQMSTFSKCIFKSLHFRNAFSKVHIFVAEQCERKVNTGTFLSIFNGIRSNLNIIIIIVVIMRTTYYVLHNL